MGMFSYIFHAMYNTKSKFISIKLKFHGESSLMIANHTIIIYILIIGIE